VRVLHLQAVERSVGDAQAASKGEQSQVSNHDGLHKGSMGTAATPTGCRRVVVSLPLVRVKCDSRVTPTRPGAFHADSYTLGQAH
jgi:hypothetical protein